MSDTIIRVANLGKKYIIGHQQRQRSLREAISATPSFIGKKILTSWRGGNHVEHEEFWALKDIGFEIKDGEVVGIIGRNGAGKSTLLKILSRITEPSCGKILITGRVASLLEVGTGFHPELTGRENIYLNGAILGMSKAEIKKKFEEIVAFAEVEKFLDTPVKRYSSGMYVRLAFAVAAHLEPEILLVDEVLAVGDVAFQKKSLGKMGDVAKNEGRTVLFVSHNMAAVEKICRRGILLQKGKIKYIGSQSEAISQYLASSEAEKIKGIRDRQDRQGTGEIIIVNIQIKDEKGNIIDVVSSGQNIDIYLYFEKKVKNKLSKIQVSLMLKTQLDVAVFLMHNRMTGNDFGNLPEAGCFICRISRLPLPSSTYKLGYSLMPNNGRDGTYLDKIDDAVDLTVVEGDFYGSGEIPPVSHGVCLVDAEWWVLEGS